jgi:flagellar hook assembly protein FlgD
MVGSITENNQIPKRYALYQNYPNPFNPSTIIRFDIAEKSHVTLKIFNILGQEVRTLINSVVTPGEKSVSWDGRNDNGLTVNSGIYIYVINAGDYRESKKMIFIK